MTRCDYDAMFYRVFCITLLAIAFTFTVILTSVFIDIDGLLVSKKENLNHNIIRRNEYTTEATDNDDMNYVNSEDSYRTKRSIETQSFLFHIKNPKVKNILANRLSTLLEELEAEESADMKPTEKNIKAKTEESTKAAETPKLAEDESKDKMLHLSMHNILLQGIERHLDLNDVFKKMFASISNFNNFHDTRRKDEPKHKPYEMEKDGEELKLPRPLEKFFHEMLNNNELQDKIMQTTTMKPVKAPPNVVIKTVIDITSHHNKVKQNDTKSSNEIIQGDVELVYNGKVIKFTHSDTETVQTLPEKKLPVKTTLKPKRTIETTTTDYFNLLPKSYMNKFVEEYFKHFPHDTKESTSNEINQHFQTKRLKRHVRIKYENENSGEPKNTFKKNTEEDELYVEIETHFDSKGMKGEKKKKLIKSLIEKIKQAIHSDMSGKLMTTGRNNTKKIRKSVHFRKRIQNPLDHKFSHVFVDKYNIPTSNVVHRELHPISKTIPLEDISAPAIGTKSGEEWRKLNFGPGFLTSTKAINSAEMSELNVDYSKILEVNGIPQRLQQPLNTELSEETIKTNSYYDMGKMKFVIKDIDGSGFSVGFNQYVDELPDKESMRLFSGLENVLNSNHQTSDSTAEPISTTEAMLQIEERRMEPTGDEHIIERRSIDKNQDYHSNEYKIIFNNNFMPYKNYRDIYKSKVAKNKNTQKKKKKVSLVLDENIFEKNLKPSEILTLADLFDRKKRSVNKDSVKVISNLRSRRKVNRFLNTNNRPKTIYLNTKNKRNKRQINKIRIIATDLPQMSQHSDENIFIVSDENVMADRALLKEVETSDGGEKQEDTQYFDPYPNDESSAYITKIFDKRSRHNPLMSKYPHIFMEEISRSREDFIPNNALLFGKLPGLGKRNPEVDNNDDDKIDIDQFMSPARINETESRKQFSEQEMLSALIAAPVDKPNYKVTVKIIPKNQTDLNSGFKEIHTSINKSFNRNGLLYSSLVNVSEISKVVKLNRSNEEIRDDNPNSRKEESLMTQKIQDQQEKMQFLLKQHAKHITEQLRRLHEEKMNLESLLIGDNSTDIVNKALNLTTRRLKLAAAIVEVTTTTTEAVNEVQTTTVPPTPSVEIFPSTTTPSHDTKLQNFQEKVKNNNILSTIERNGNLTDQILKKIDRNTEILQMFLQKLTEKIESPPIIATPKIEIVKDNHDTDWTNQEQAYTQHMVIRKNDSHISIPFTYAYQPPTSLPVKSKTQVASVVYQGHIRNAVRHRDSPLLDQENQLQKVQEVNNQSKFFIDDLENGYKIIKIGGYKKNRDYNLVNNNSTSR